jgi:hypothetical protein
MKEQSSILTPNNDLVGVKKSEKKEEKEPKLPKPTGLEDDSFTFQDERKN